MAKGWVGFDLDGTIAHYDRWRGPNHIGKPVEKMLVIMRGYIARGIPVKIFTARVSHDEDETREFMQALHRWCEENELPPLPATCRKDYQCLRIYDDRAVAVGKNTGEIAYFGELP